MAINIPKFRSLKSIYNYLSCIPKRKQTVYLLEDFGLWGEQLASYHYKRVWRQQITQNIYLTHLYFVDPKIKLKLNKYYTENVQT